MENIIDFLATKEVLIVLAIIGIILFVYFILWFHEFLKKHEEKKKLQNNTMQLNKLVEEVARANKEENVQITKEEPKKEEIKRKQRNASLCVLGRCGCRPCLPCACGVNQNCGRSQGYALFPARCYRAYHHRHRFGPFGFGR